MITLTVNGKVHQTEVYTNEVLIDTLRRLGYKSVKRGCETANCGLCTVLLDDKAILSCSLLSLRADGKHILTLEGVREEAKLLGGFLAEQGGEQCGYCTPGLMMNTIAMKRELVDPTDEEIAHYLMGNLCRCSGYVSQLRAIRQYLEV